jgi:hypothetical protein
MKRIHVMLSLVIMMLTFSSCAVVGGIFKAGVWTGVFIVAAIIAVIIFLITRSAKK